MINEKYEKQNKDIIALMKKLKELEKELQRKEKALAEAAPLLILKILETLTCGEDDGSLKITKPKSLCGLKKHLKTGPATAKPVACSGSRTERFSAGRKGAGKTVEKPQVKRGKEKYHSKPENRMSPSAMSRGSVLGPDAVGYIVPHLLKDGRYLDSERTVYRILIEADQVQHRSELRIDKKHAKPTVRKTT